MHRIGRIVLAAAVLVPVLASPASSQRDWTEQEKADYEARTAKVERGELLHNEKPSRKAVQKAKALGLRTDGVYWHNDPDSAYWIGADQYDADGKVYTTFIRFCEDGSVVDAVTSGTPDDVKRWLVCDPVNPVYSHGVLKVDGKTLKFRLYMATGSIDYWGTFKPDANSGFAKLVLNVRTNIGFAQTYGTTQVEDYKFHRW